MRYIQHGRTPEGVKAPWRQFCCVMLVLLPLLKPVPSRADSFMRSTSEYFGTVSMLRLYDTEGAQETWEAVRALLSGIEEAVSVSVRSSDIARFNRLQAGESLAVSAITAELFRAARDVYDLTGGLYDPTVYPLVDLWGFSPRFSDSDDEPVMPYDRPFRNGRPVPPGARYIDLLLPLVGMDGIILTETEDGWLLTKRTPAVKIGDVTIQAQLDLGGIAKGYACDCVRQLLVRRGYTEGYFICGDSSMTFLGGTDGHPYRVAAGKPRMTANPGSAYAGFMLENASLATSSDAAHAYDADGAHWCHLIDPRTGWPVNRPDAQGLQAGAASVTLIGQDAALLDAMGTALCILGPEAALAFLEERPEQMVMAVWRSDSDQYTVVTNMDPAGLTLPDPAYRLQ